MSDDQRATAPAREPSARRILPAIAALEVLDLVGPGGSCRPDGVCD